MKVKQVVLILASLWLLTAWPAQGQGGLSLSVTPGFDQFYKAGTWTPLRVTVANDGPPIEGTLQLLNHASTFERPDILYQQVVDLPSQSRKEYTLYAHLEAVIRVRVQLVDQNGTVLQTADSLVRALNPDDFLIAVLADDMSLLNPLSTLGITEDDDEPQTVISHLRALSELPPMPQAWENLDMLVFNDVDTTALTPPQRAALQNWVYQGGVLLVGGGPTGSQTVAGLSDLLPFQQVAIETLPHPLLGLRDFVSLSLSDRGPYVAAVPQAATGELLLTEGDTPLIIRHQPNRGQVYYSAFDLSRAPMDRVVLLPEFWQNLGITFQPQQGLLFQPAKIWQIENSLSVLTNQGLPSPILLCIYLLLYVILIGPLNYFALWFIRRKEWAWVTIPLIILLCTAFTYFTGLRTRGQEVVLSQINLIQTTPNSLIAPVTSFMGIYSPRRDQYTVDLPPATLVESMGGGSGLNRQLQVTMADTTRLSNLRGDIGGLPTFRAYSITTPPQISSNIQLNWEAKTGRGYLINNSQQTLQHVALVWVDKAAYDPELPGYSQAEIELYTLELDDLSSGQTEIEGQFEERGGMSNQTFYAAAEKSSDITVVSRDLVLRALFESPRMNGQLPAQQWLYLVGWQANNPVPLQLLRHNGSQNQQTLLLLNLPLVLE